MALTDSEFMLAVLRQGAATTMELIRRSFQERGCGLTPHSRAADLRRQLAPAGQTVRCRTRPRPESRKKVEWVYEIVTTKEGER